jgi:hypothetical protein
MRVEQTDHDLQSVQMAQRFDPNKGEWIEMEGGR